MWLVAKKPHVHAVIIHEYGVRFHGHGINFPEFALRFHNYGAKFSELAVSESEYGAMKKAQTPGGCLRFVVCGAAASAAGPGLEAHAAEEDGGVGVAYLVVVEQLGQLAEGLAELAY